MSYDEGIAERVRIALAGQEGVVEKKMFGGLAFMLRGNMCCGVQGTDLMLRVGADGYAAALEEPDARKMDFTGKALSGFIYVDQTLADARERLPLWLDRALEYIATLPSKQGKAKPRRNHINRGRS
jgi:TfoX/Sxy family transcriptional regulator of competence genes